MTMAPGLLGSVAIVLWHAVGALTVAVEPVIPQIVIPGEWKTDHADHFLFLPLTVPAQMRAQAKVMTNGQQLLIVVTERPEEEPETKALQKYKLVMEALKQEALHDESLLQGKLQTWLDTEDDDEVKVHIQAAVNSLNKIRDAKKKVADKSVSVPLGVPHAKSLLELSSTPNASKPIVKASVAPPHALPALLRGAAVSEHSQHQRHYAAKVIKESFAIEIPFPVPTDQVVVLQASPTTMMVAMPLVRKSLESSGISTGGKPFLRVPLFNNKGAWMVGPKVDLSRTLEGLDVSKVVSQQDMESLVGF